MQEQFHAILGPFRRFKWERRDKSGVLLFDDKPAQWTDVLATGDEPLIRAYGRFRKFAVDHMLKKITRSVGCDRNCFRSVGSTKIDSDYDVTVTTNQNSEVVRIFNTTFRNEFGDNSDNVFDTNVYGAAFLTEHHDVYDYITIQGVAHRFVTVSGAEGRIDVRNQHFWALAQVALADPSLKLNGLDNYWATLWSQAVEFVRNNRPHLAGYEKALKNIEQCRHAMEKKPDDMNLRVLYKDSIARANFYGVGTYFTQGTFVDVVINQQMGGKVHLTPDEYLDSAIENIGEMMRGHKVMKYRTRAYKALSHILHRQDYTILLTKRDPRQLLERILQLKRFIVRDAQNSV